MLKRGNGKETKLPPAPAIAQPFIALTLQRRLNIRLRLGQSDHLARFLPLPAFLEQIDALKTFQDVALGRNGAGPLETAML